MTAAELDRQSNGDESDLEGRAAKILARLSTDPGRLSDDEYRRLEIEVLAEIKAQLGKQKMEDVQYELARLACLMPAMRNCSQLDRLSYIQAAVQAMAGSDSNKDFARFIRSDLEFFVLRSQRGMFRFVYRLSGATALSAVLAGLIMSALAMSVMGVAVGLTMPAHSAHRLGLWDDHLIFHMALLAAAGGYISVLSRLGQFAVARAYDPFLFFATGFFKPWVSVGFAIFLYCVLKAGLIKISDFDPNGDRASHFFIVVAFIAGFSERFISDFIAKTEDHVLGPPPRKDGKPAGMKEAA